MPIQDLEAELERLHHKYRRGSFSDEKHLHSALCKLEKRGEKLIDESSQPEAVTLRVKALLKHIAQYRAVLLKHAEEPWGKIIKKGMKKTTKALKSRKKKPTKSNSGKSRQGPRRR